MNDFDSKDTSWHDFCYIKVKNKKSNYMSIVLGRIDYRLLHGIVATMWAPQSGAQRVMVIDDKTANDPVIKESMRLGKTSRYGLFYHH